VPENANIGSSSPKTSPKPWRASVEHIGSKGVRTMSKVMAFFKDESGATAIEYGLIAAGISVVIIATVNAIGSTLNAKFDYISQQLK
jgi:pilus assembly protein Flp/PilA